MMTIKQIQDRLKDDNITPEEISFLEDQLWEIKLIADEYQQTTLEELNHFTGGTR